jgi:hypothetical protein
MFPAPERDELWKIEPSVNRQKHPFHWVLHRFCQFVKVVEVLDIAEP